MSQLGGEIRFSVRVDRPSCTEGFRFGFRTLPAARRSRHRLAALAIVFVLLAVGTVGASSSAGESFGEAIGGGAGFVGFVAAFSVLASSRVRAWTAARQVFKDLPDEYVAVCHFDPAGYDATGGGRSVHFDWSTISAVVEGDRFLALGVGRTQLVSVRIEQLTDIERTTIRRWADAAPGGPRWEVRRTRREHPRLQVSPSAGLAPDERAPIATAD